MAETERIQLRWYVKMRKIGPHAPEEAGRELQFRRITFNDADNVREIGDWETVPEVTWS